MEDNKLQELAELAAEVVSQGWMQGMYFDREGNYCAFGALNKAISELNYDPYYLGMTSDKANSYIKGVLGFQFDPLKPGTLITQWNDTLGRTQDEVVDMWKNVAKEISNEKGTK